MSETKYHWNRRDLVIETNEDDDETAENKEEITAD